MAAEILKDGKASAAAPEWTCAAWNRFNLRGTKPRRRVWANRYFGGEQCRGSAPENLAEDVREEDFDATLEVKPGKGHFLRARRRANHDPAEERERKLST